MALPLMQVRPSPPRRGNPDQHFSFAGRGISAAGNTCCRGVMLIVRISPLMNLVLL